MEAIDTWWDIETDEDLEEFDKLIIKQGNRCAHCKEQAGENFSEFFFVIDAETEETVLVCWDCLQDLSVGTEDI